MVDLNQQLWLQLLVSMYVCGVSFSQGGRDVDLRPRRQVM